MRKLFFLLLSSTMFVAALQAQSLPYSANYSSNFKMATHDLSSMVLQLYKAYETNDFSKEDWFADTLMVVLDNGQVLTGKATALQAFKDARQNDGDTKFVFDAIIPLTSVDRKENWVSLWGNTTTSRGKTEFQAIWKINSQKKVAFIKFFQAAPMQ